MERPVAGGAKDFDDTLSFKGNMFSSETLAKKGLSGCSTRMTRAIRPAISPRQPPVKPRALQVDRHRHGDGIKGDLFGPRKTARC